MAKKKQSVSDFIEDLRLDMVHTNISVDIPDIITFVEGEDWLSLPFPLFPMQKIALKAFYRGSIGNENIFLTDEEIARCKDLGLDMEDRGAFLQSVLNDNTVFRELVLVWGRRSGKDFITSIIAAYEAMKLLECKGGDPYAIYELSSANTINILTVANSSSQAQIAYQEIMARIMGSPYFQDKFHKDGISSSAIYLLTPKDKEENRERVAKGLPIKKGSVCIIVGHSNSDTLLGIGCIVLILDEVASYKMTGGSSSGDRIYAALTPTVQTYVRRIYAKDSNGDFIIDSNGQKIVKERIYDGKIISISSPRAKEGKFYELFENAPHVRNRLAMRCATWEINLSHTRESLRTDDNTLSETEFNMEFGAEFSGIGLEQFFTDDQLKPVFIGHQYRFMDLGAPGHVYFVHLDPALNSHNYALAVVHKEYYMNPLTNGAEYKIIVDHIKFWEPTNGPIDVEEVSAYVVGLKRRFNIGLMTYDQWASAESILKLRRAGIPNKMTRFTGQYKNTIYRELENLVNSNRIFIPYHDYLKQEMVELQRRFTQNGFKVMPKKDGDGVKTDDIVDCVAGASYVAIEKNAHKLPHGRLANVGNPMDNNMAWRGPQGVMGVGSGSQVSSMLSYRYQRYMPNKYGRSFR